MKRISVMMITVLMSLLFIVGCDNTVHGFGKDMQNAGQNIQNSADSH